MRSGDVIGVSSWSATLLAMVDASIGGKTAVNHAGAKMVTYLSNGIGCSTIRWDDMRNLVPGADVGLRRPEQVEVEPGPPDAVMMQPRRGQVHSGSGSFLHDVGQHS